MLSNSSKREQTSVITQQQWRIQGGRQGHKPSISVQFLTFSRNFWQKSCQIVGFSLKLWGCARRPLPSREILDPSLTNINGYGYNREVALLVFS